MWQQIGQGEPSMNILSIITLHPSRNTPCAYLHIHCRNQMLVMRIHSNPAPVTLSTWMEHLHILQQVFTTLGNNTCFLSYLALFKAQFLIQCGQDHSMSPGQYSRHQLWIFSLLEWRRKWVVHGMFLLILRFMIVFRWHALVQAVITTLTLLNQNL